MTDQVTFFNDDSVIPPYQNPYQQEVWASSGKPENITKRVFLYGRDVFEDPGSDYAIHDVMQILSKTYPDLGNGSWTTQYVPDPAIPGGSIEEITFIKNMGEKGRAATCCPA